MESSNRLAQEAVRDGCWVEMRLHKDALNSLATGRNAIDQSDFLSFFQCLTLVLTEIALYEKDFIYSDREIEELFFDKSSEGAFLRIIKEVSYWKIIEDKKNTQEERLGILEKLRKCVWGHIVPLKDKLIELVKKYPNITDPGDLALLFQCVSLVVVQLELKDKEIEILEEN